MPRVFDSTIILAAPPHTRARYVAWRGLARMRAGMIAALVILVPGAWLLWLLWHAVRRVRAAMTDEP